MIETIGEGVWLARGARPGARVGISFGVHGNERAPVEAGRGLAADLEAGRLQLVAGTLLLLHANPLATAQDRRWSEGGVDLNRCFHADSLGGGGTLHEELRARAVAGWLEQHAVEVLVDFHCTVEPGERFLMHHPSVRDEAHARVARLLRAEVQLADPELVFGGVSLDEYQSTRGRVGVCYETGWLGDPDNGPDDVRAEMENLLRGLGLLAGEAREHAGKRQLELDGRVVCEADGFRWRDGVGRNLQELPAGAVLGAYPDGREVRLERAATLIFPKKRPELLQVGKPLVLLASRR